MFERFARDTRKTVRRAVELAENEGAAMVEVEHLLTALVDPATDEIGHQLLSAGVTPGRLRTARDSEFQSALALAGVGTERPAPAAARRVRRGRSTQFAPSAKLALQRTLESALEAGDRRITNESLFEGIISSHVGIMPRLLNELGTDASELRRAVLATH